MVTRAATESAMKGPTYHPSREEFCAKARDARAVARRGVLVPVYHEILADLETPVSAFLKLSERNGEHAFLLESVTGGEQIARYSYMGVRPAAVITTRGREVQRLAADGTRDAWELQEGEDPLDLLKAELTERAYVPIEGWERFVGGAVGFLGYDLVRFFEDLPDNNADDRNLPDCALMITGVLVAFDHVQHKIRILANAPYEGGDPNEAYDRGIAQIEETVATLRQPLKSPQAEPIGPSRDVEVASNFTRPDFERAVQKAKEYIAAGDCIQVVLSQRLATRVSAHPFTVYRALRSVSPAPYMFYLAFGDLKIVGASPEILVTEDRGRVLTRPLAGTRPRGATPEEDAQLETELLADEKERAEHVMLVDLARNDIGRVCSYGSVQADQLMFVDRWSHVMHIVSNVNGRLMPGKDQFDLLRATFPAGTLSGAPKVRAMEIIDELEPTRRGPYGGAIGYFSYSGSMDTAITIRTAVIKGDMAYVQVGAGIVADSVPSREYEETYHKARAAILAIRQAEEGLE